MKVVECVGKLNKYNWATEAVNVAQQVVDLAVPGSGYVVEFGEDFMMYPYCASEHKIVLPQDVVGYFAEYGHLLRPGDDEIQCLLHEVGHVVEEVKSQRDEETVINMNWRMQMTARYYLSNIEDETASQRVYEQLPAEVAADKWAYEQLGKEYAVVPLELLSQEDCDAFAELLNEEWAAHLLSLDDGLEITSAQELDDYFDNLPELY